MRGYKKFFHDLFPVLLNDCVSVVLTQGPVYAVQWSPFNSNVFLSSSTDWDVKIWHQDWSYAAFSLTSPLVSDTYCCPRSPCSRPVEIYHVVA